MGQLPPSTPPCHDPVLRFVSRYFLCQKDKLDKSTYPDDVLGLWHLIAWVPLHHFDHGSVQSFTQLQILARHRTLNVTFLQYK